MNVPTLSPGNRGYDVVTITTVKGTSAPLTTEDQPPRHEQRLEENAGRELRLAHPPLDEDDRHLADAESPFARVEQHLDEKRIAVGDHVGNRQTRQRFAPPAAVPARAVAGRQARHESDVAV